MQLDFTSILHNVRERAPLIHSITNYVTVNDVANVLLACGASPIMADDADEVAEITSICAGLTINLGTLNRRTISSMLLAGRRANELSHPVLLDPVGAGASRLRTETAQTLIEEIRFTVIRGNVSEIKTLALGGGTTKGVDADAADTATEANLDAVINFAKSMAQAADTVIAITGAIDIVTDGEKTYVIRNGHPMMAHITGSGCMLSGLMTAFVTANPACVLEAAAASVIAMGLAGERAYAKTVQVSAGTATFRNFLIDEISTMTSAILREGAKYVVR